MSTSKRPELSPDQGLHYIMLGLPPLAMARIRELGEQMAGNPHSAALRHAFRQAIADALPKLRDVRFDVMPIERGRMM